MDFQNPASNLPNNAPVQLQHSQRLRTRLLRFRLTKVEEATLAEMLSGVTTADED